MKLNEKNPFDLHPNLNILEFILNPSVFLVIFTKFKLDQGQPDQSRKRADMMTFSGGCVRENQCLNFNKNTCFIMDVTIGRVCCATLFQAKEYSSHGNKKTTQIRRTLPTTTFGFCFNGCKYNLVLTVYNFYGF